MEALYKIYLNCEKREVLSYDEFLNVIQLKENKIIKYEEGSKILGFSIINKNRILFIGVSNESRGKVIGSKLLESTEESILKQGYNKIIIEGNFLPHDIRSYAFFEKMGYEDFIIESDFLFSFDSVFNSSDYEFRVNDYNLLKSTLKEMDLKVAKCIDFDKDLLMCLKQDKLLGYCQYRIGNFEEIGKVGIVEPLYILPEYYDIFSEENIIDNVKYLLSKQGISNLIVKSIGNNIFRDKYIQNIYVDHAKLIKFI